MNHTVKQNDEKRKEKKSLFKEIYNLKYLTKFTKIKKQSFSHFWSWDISNSMHTTCTTHGCSRNTLIIVTRSMFENYFVISCHRANGFDVVRYSNSNSNVCPAHSNGIINNNTYS